MNTADTDGTATRVGGRTGPEAGDGPRMNTADTDGTATRVGGRVPRTAPVGAPSAGAPSVGMAYFLVLGTSLAASLAYHMAVLGRSVAMGQLGFAATAISITTAIAGAVMIPAPMLLGWLSDRAGRKGPLLAAWVLCLAALLILAGASSEWAFWGATVLLAIVASAFAVVNALTTDVLPPAVLGRGLAVQGAVVSGGYLLGSLLMGVILERLGARPAFLIAAAAGVAAIALLAPLHEAVRRGAR